MLMWRTKSIGNFVFLDIYPKNGPLQQLDIADNDLKSLLKEFIEEAQSNNLLDYAIEIK